MILTKKVTTDYTSDFRTMALQIAKFGAKAGVKIRPFKDEDLPYFSKLPIDKRKQIISSLDFLIRVCEATIKNGYSADDSAQLTWYAIKELGWRPSSDLFEKIDNDSIIEIYDTNNLQVFRNFNFFDFCSYTLEEIHCIPWTTLYYRPDESITKEILRHISDHFESHSYTTKYVGIPKHSVKETRSAQKYELFISLEYISLLFNSANSPEAIVAIETAKFNGPQTSVQNEEDAYLRHFDEKFTQI